MAPPWFALPRRTTTPVAIVVDPADYARTVEAAKNGGFSLDERRRLAAGAFAHTAAYDTAVATWTASQFLQDEDANFWPPYAGLGFERSETLRYGENPHQRAALYVDPAAAPGIAQAEQLHGKAMSYNNYVDADAALRAAYDFDEPAVAVIKHNNPCGIAVATPARLTRLRTLTRRRTLATRCPHTVV